MFAFGVYKVDPISEGQPHLYFGGFLGIFMVSARFAHGAASGWAAAHLCRDANAIVLEPYANDRAAGFGRLGRYYFDQALVLLLPTVFMAFWIVFVHLNIMKIEDATAESSSYQEFLEKIQYVNVLYITCENHAYDPRYCFGKDLNSLWIEPNIYLIFFNIMIFTLSWVVPMYYLSRKMLRYKRERLEPEVWRLQALLYASRLAILRHHPRQSHTSPLSTQYEATKEIVLQLAALRDCPTLPIPIWAVSMTLISNISAFIGLLSFVFS